MAGCGRTSSLKDLSPQTLAYLVVDHGAWDFFEPVRNPDDVVREELALVLCKNTAYAIDGRAAREFGTCLLRERCICGDFRTALAGPTTRFEQFVDARSRP